MTREEEIYEGLCKNCPSAKQCHDDCASCTVFDDINECKVNDLRAKWDICDKSNCPHKDKCPILKRIKDNFIKAWENDVMEYGD